MDPALIALLALIASALQIAILRAIDYYFPRGHTRVDDLIAETKSQRAKRHDLIDKHQQKELETRDDNFEVVAPDKIIE